SRRDRKMAEKQNPPKAGIADQRNVELDIEKTRERHIEANDSFNEVQGRFYAVGADIARIEQAIQHGKELRQRQERELAQAEHAWQEVQGHIERDREQLEDVTSALAEMEPGLERLRAAEQEASQAMQAAEEAMQAWQAAWEACHRNSSQASQSAQVERTQIEHLERQVQQINNRIAKLKEEAAQLDPNALEAELQNLAAAEQAAGEQRERLQQELDERLEEITRLREEDRQLTQTLHDKRSALEDGRGRLSSLEALQQSALGKSRAHVNDWLAAHSLESLPRLAEKLSVRDGWERAVETVLGHHLEAVCVEEIADLDHAIRELCEGAVTLLDASRAAAAAGSGPSAPLADFVSADRPLDTLLAGVFTAENLPAALALRSRLNAGQSVITRDGIWLGPNWLRINREQDEHAGVLAREAEIKTLKEAQDRLANEVTELAGRQEAIRERLKDAELRREELQVEVNRAHRQYADARAMLDARRERQEQLRRRAAEVNGELEELHAELEQHDADIRAARSRLDETLSSLQGFEADHGSLIAQRDEIRARLERARE